MRISSLLVLLLFLPSAALLAQGEDTSNVVLWPPELYPGKNVVSVTAAEGLREIAVIGAANVHVQGDGDAACAASRSLTIEVLATSARAELLLRVTDCAGRVITRSLGVHTTWTLNTVDFGEVEQGRNICKEFHVHWRGAPDQTETFIDSITIAEPRARLRVDRSLPASLEEGESLDYEVCVDAATPGIHSFPVTAWVRRRYPSGELGSYAVTDTGLIAVFPPSARVTDPSTFRSVIVPNAIIPKQGSVAVASYDLLGVLAGYVPFKNVMIIAGGALPTPDDWAGIHDEMFGAYSLGLKGGVQLLDHLNIAVGFQWGASLFDKAATPGDRESQIRLSVSYAAFSYGDDDSRVSGTFGFGLKHHRRYDLTHLSPVEEFERQVLICAVGGDYRVGTHWKVAGEIATAETLGLIPVIVTGRYFTNGYAIDVGAVFMGFTTGGVPAPKLPLLPVVSGVFMF